MIVRLVVLMDRVEWVLWRGEEEAEREEGAMRRDGDGFVSWDGIANCAGTGDGRIVEI